MHSISGNNIGRHLLQQAAREQVKEQASLDGQLLAYSFHIRIRHSLPAGYGLISSLCAFSNLTTSVHLVLFRCSSWPESFIGCASDHGLLTHVHRLKREEALPADDIHA